MQHYSSICHGELESFNHRSFKTHRFSFPLESVKRKKSVERDRAELEKKILSRLKITAILLPASHRIHFATPLQLCASKKVHFVLPLFLSLHLTLPSCFVYFLLFCTDNYSESNNEQHLHSERTSGKPERHQSPSNFARITFSITKSKCYLSCPINGHGAALILIFYLLRCRGLRFLCTIPTTTLHNSY